MTYVSLYRKWRPQTFDEIAGQSHVTQTLKNAIKQGRVSHAYLFCGPRGTGKTTTARILAKAINCEKGPTVNPCNECESCGSIADGSSVDVLELDAASNRKVDEIREFLEKIPYSSTQGGKKVYIIDEVHMLTTESFNTLLKTLEEPPEHVIFILATTEPNKVLPTILSRCQRFDFARISVTDIKSRLRFVADAEGIKVDDSALELIANHVRGALRDALGILEQLASYAKKKIVSTDVTMLLGVTDLSVLYGFTSMLATGDLAGALLFLEERAAKGQDMRQLVQDLLEYLRDLYLVQSVNSIRPKSVTDELWDDFSEQAASINSRSLLFYISTLNDVFNQTRWSTNVRLQVEIALFKMIKTGDDISLEGLLHRIERIENVLLNGIMQTGDNNVNVPENRPAKGRKTRLTKKAKQTGKIEKSTPTKSDTGDTGNVEAGSQSDADDKVEKTDTVGEAVDMETIKRHWPQVLKLIREKKRARYHFFASAKVKRIEDGKLVLAIKAAEKQFIENPENLQLLRNALKIAGGIDMQIICETTGGKSKTVAVVDSPDTEVVNEKNDEVLAVGDYIKMVQDTFGAKIVEDITLNEK